LGTQGLTKVVTQGVTQGKRLTLKKCLGHGVTVTLGSPGGT